MIAKLRCRWLVSCLALAGCAGLPTLASGSASSRTGSTGITISLRREPTVSTGTAICAGACFVGTNVVVTVWSDGQISIDGRNPFRVSREDAARFQSTLAPFRRPGSYADASSSHILSKLCPVEIQWPADDAGVRPMTCASYSVGEIQDSVFEAVARAFSAIHLDRNGYPLPR